MAGSGRILVTGGSGLLGRHVVEELAGACDVRVLDLRPPQDPAIEFKAADVRDLDAVVAAVQGCQAVVHLAGLDFAVSATPRAFFETNVQGTWNVFHAAERAAVRKVVYCSSEAALGLESVEEDLPPVYLPFDGRHPLRPTHTYGLTKQIGESVARSFVRRGRMSVLCLRPTAVLFDEQIAWAVACGLAGDAEPTLRSEARELPGAGDEEPPLFPCYVRPEDCARCFRLALESAACDAFDVFHVSAADTFSTRPTLALLADLYGRPPEIRRPSLFEQNPFASVFDLSRARDKLGWEPRGDWVTLLREKAPEYADLFHERRAAATKSAP